MTKIPASLYEPHITRSTTFITTFTVDAGEPTEHEYDALIIELPDLLDAINAEGLPTVCPECEALSSLSVPVKDMRQWEVSTTHMPDCAATATPPRPHLRAVPDGDES